MARAKSTRRRTVAASTNAANDDAVALPIGDVGVASTGTVLLRVF